MVLFSFRVFQDGGHQFSIIFQITLDKVESSLEAEILVNAFSLYELSIENGVNFSFKQS